jgi:hypothetical protein
MKEVRKLAKICGPGTGGGGIDAPGGDKRPNLTVHSDDSPAPPPTPRTMPTGPLDAGVVPTAPSDATLHAPTPTKDPKDGTGGQGSAHPPDTGSGSAEAQPDGAGSGSP